MDKKDYIGTNCIKNNRHDYFKVINTYLDKNIMKMRHKHLYTI